MKKSRLIGASSACVFAFAVTSAHAVYTITDLSPLIGASSTVTDINNRGWLTGTSNGHAFIYDGTTMHDLGTLGGTSSSSAGINNSGWVTGTSYTSDGHQHAFLYDGTTMQDIGTFSAGGTQSSGMAINDIGWVTGSGNFVDPSIADYGGGTHAFLYDGTTMHDLGDLGFPGSYGFGINNSGWVTGYSWIDEGRYHAFLYDGSTMQDIGTLGWGGEDVEGHAINERGWITGDNWLGEPPPGHAFIYDGSTMLDLGTLYDMDYSSGSDINNRGLVVGLSSNSSYPLNFTAFFYDGNSMLDLCVLTDCTANGWDGLTFASDINDRGDIIGEGIINGERHEFLVSAVPIPPSVWLFSSGLLGLIGMARRKKAA